MTAMGGKRSLMVVVVARHRRTFARPLDEQVIPITRVKQCCDDQGNQQQNDELCHSTMVASVVGCPHRVESGHFQNTWLASLMTSLAMANLSGIAASAPPLGPIWINLWQAPLDQTPLHWRSVVHHQGCVHEQAARFFHG
jgi:hypothetical protein